MEIWWLGLVIVWPLPILAFHNSTLVENSIESRWETEGSCRAGEWGACMEGGVLASFSALVGKELKFSKAAKLVRTEIELDREEPKSEGGILSRLAKMGDDFIRSAGIEIELTPEVTENGRYEPRFIDEIYTELDKLQLKHAKPSKQSELKRLFIPLLVILKVFKLKLLLLLPIIFGLASFKKVIAVAIMLLPAAIAYFKVCKPDLRQSYGAYGHSSYYQSPPSHSYTQYSKDGVAYDRMSYRKNDEQLAYKGYQR